MFWEPKGSDLPAVSVPCPFRPPRRVRVSSFLVLTLHGGVGVVEKGLWELRIPQEAEHRA